MKDAWANYHEYTKLNFTSQQVKWMQLCKAELNGSF